MSLSTTEAKIAADWNAVRAYVATHQMVTIIAVAVVAAVLGHVL